MQICEIKGVIAGAELLSTILHVVFGLDDTDACVEETVSFLHGCSWP